MDERDGDFFKGLVVGMGCSALIWAAFAAAFLHWWSS